MKSDVFLRLVGLRSELMRRVRQKPSTPSRPGRAWSKAPGRVGDRAEVSQ